MGSFPKLVLDELLYLARNAARASCDLFSLFGLGQEASDTDRRGNADDMTGERHMPFSFTAHEFLLSRFILILPAKRGFIRARVDFFCKF